MEKGGRETQVKADQRRYQWSLAKLIEEVLEAWLTFRGLFEKYRKGTLSFGDLASFVDDKDLTSPLYRLKELSHKLFRNPESEVPVEGRLLDLTIGSIFHEAMKMREDLYQLEVYWPYYQRLKEEGLLVYREQLGDEFQKLKQKAAKSLRDGFSETKRLFKSTLIQSKAILFTEGRKNPLILRLLIAKGRLFRRAYGKDGFRRLLLEVFPEGFEEALKEAALSFTEAMHLEQAQAIWTRYMRSRPEDTEGKFFYLYCKGYRAYLEHRYSRMLEAFEKAVETALNLRSPRLMLFLERIGELLSGVMREVEKKSPKGCHQRALAVLEKAKSILSKGG